MADTGFKNAGTGADDATVGTVAWVLPGNITADDANYASYTGGTSGAYSDNSIKLIIGGSITGNEKSTGTSHPTVDTMSSVYGGAADLWGTTPTAAQVKASNFGVGISAKRNTSVSHYAAGTNYDFSAIPDGSTINGIEMQFKRYYGPNLASFIAGTMVKTLTGEVPIEKLKPGDLVLGFVDKNIDAYRVSRVWSRKNKEIIRLVIDGVEVVTTPNHQFFTTAGIFKPASKLVVGEAVYQLRGNEMTVAFIEDKSNIGTADVFNITVEKAHTFFANGLAVHNGPASDGNLDFINVVQMRITYTPPASKGLPFYPKMRNSVLLRR